MSSPSTSSSADEQQQQQSGELHADDTSVANLDVLQPGQSPPRSIGMGTKARSLGKTRGSSGKPPVPTTVDFADIPTRQIAVKADTPKKREESRKNDVLVEQQMKATRINDGSRLDSIARKVHRLPPPAPPQELRPPEEEVDWVAVGIVVGAGAMIGLSLYFLWKNMTASNVGPYPAPPAAPAALPGAYPAPPSFQ